MDEKQKQQQQQEQGEWAEVIACDPFTLVSQTKHTIYKLKSGEQPDPTELKQLEEISSRFEQQARASLGTGVVSVGGPVAAGRS